MTKYVVPSYVHSVQNVDYDLGIVYSNEDQHLQRIQTK